MLIAVQYLIPQNIMFFIVFHGVSDDGRSVIELQNLFPLSTYCLKKCKKTPTVTTTS